MAGMSFPGGEEGEEGEEEGEGEGAVVLCGMVKSRRKIFVGPAKPSVEWEEKGGVSIVGVMGEGWEGRREKGLEGVTYCKLRHRPGCSRRTRRRARW
jgi:hypothetical protein